MSKHLDELAAAARALVRTNAAARTGVFRRRDLLAWGLDDAVLQAMFRRGLWVRLRHGVYADAEVIADADPLARHRLHLAAAIAASEEPAFAVGPSAAVVHGQPLRAGAPDEVYLVRESGQDLRSLGRPSKHPLEIPRMRIMSHVLSPSDVTEVGGIPTVTAPLAALTTAPGVTFFRRVGLFDAVLWDGRVTHGDLLALLDSWPSLGGRAGTLAALERARRGAQTYFETVSRLVLVGQGLPEPQLQVPIYDEDGLIGYVDMYWDDLAVIGEADGAVKYVDREVLIAEKRREDRLRARGFGVVRWMPEDLRENPERIAARIRLAARRRAA